MKTKVLRSDTMDNTRNMDYAYRFDSSKSAGEIFQLLLQIKNWWTGFYEETITGKSEKTGDEFEFLAGGGVHFSKHKLVELVPNERIVWAVTDSKLSFISKTDEWIGTKLRFDIEDNGDCRIITFTHEGLFPKLECYGSCSGAWTEYMEKLETRLK